MRSEGLLPAAGSVKIERRPADIGGAEAGLHMLVSGLQLRLGDQEILKGASLELTGGRILCVCGPSGCGKSSLLRSCLALLLDDRRENPTIGVSFQEPRLFLHRSVTRNLQLVAEAAGLGPDRSTERIAQIMGLVGLNEVGARLASRLSGGMAQRLNLARALLLEPEVLLLDEPFAHLDLPRKVGLGLEIRRGARASGQAVLLVTHDLYDAVVLGDRILFVDGPPLVVRSASEPDLSEQERTWTGAAVAGIHRNLVLQSLGLTPERGTNDGSFPRAGSPPE